MCLAGEARGATLVDYKDGLVQLLERVDSRLMQSVLLRLMAFRTPA